MILIVTACGAKKHSEPMEAYKLYKSARIKAVYNRRQGCDMAILSAKYGLVDVHDIIEPYDEVMCENRSYELSTLIVNDLIKYDYIIFYKGGAKKSYVICIENACRKAKKPLITFGYANMGDINLLPKILNNIHHNNVSTS